MLFEWYAVVSEFDLGDASANSGKPTSMSLTKVKNIKKRLFIWNYMLFSVKSGNIV